MKNWQALSARGVAVTVAAVLALSVFEIPAVADQNDAIVDLVNSAVADVGATPAAPNADATIPMTGGGAAGIASETDAGTKNVTVSLPTVGNGQLGSDGLTKTFAGSEPATSVAVQPIPDGVRALLVLDSADAPEDFSFQMGAEVAQLALDPDDGTVKAMDSTGAVIATTSAPWAVDAEGTEMSTSYSVYGTTLVQHISHNSLNRNVEYPVVADPVWVVVIAAAARICAQNALLGVASTALVDIYNGRASSKTAYVLNAIAACLVGPVGVWAWRLTPASIKSWAVRQVLYTVIYVIRKVR